jgi:hypothetical protein
MDRVENRTMLFNSMPFGTPIGAYICFVVLSAVIACLSACSKGKESGEYLGNSDKALRPKNKTNRISIAYDSGDLCFTDYDGSLWCNRSALENIKDLDKRSYDSRGYYNVANRRDVVGVSSEGSGTCYIERSGILSCFGCIFGRELFPPDNWCSNREMRFNLGPSGF